MTRKAAESLDLFMSFIQPIVAIEDFLKFSFILDSQKN